MFVILITDFCVYFVVVILSRVRGGYGVCVNKETIEWATVLACPLALLTHANHVQIWIFLIYVLPIFFVSSTVSLTSIISLWQPITLVATARNQQEAMVLRQEHNKLREK